MNPAATADDANLSEGAQQDDNDRDLSLLLDPSPATKNGSHLLDSSRFWQLVMGQEAGSNRGL